MTKNSLDENSEVLFREEMTEIIFLCIYGSYVKFWHYFKIRVNILKKSAENTYTIELWIKMKISKLRMFCTGLHS